MIRRTHDGSGLGPLPHRTRQGSPRSETGRSARRLRQASGHPQHRPLSRCVRRFEPATPGGHKLWSGYCGPVGWNAIPHVQRLHREARAAGIPICHATGLLDEESGIAGWSQAIHAGSPRRNPLNDSAARDRFARRYDIIDEVAPQTGDVVVCKTAPSAFWGTPLIAELVRLGVDTLLVTGESTSGCVRATVVDAASYRFRVQVIEDCVFDRHEACHAMNLFDMHQKYADVISIDAAVDYLRGVNGDTAVAGPALVNS